jgi:hypothetical protein
MECKDSSYHHMLVNIKALDTETSAYILAIGVVLFNPEVEESIVLKDCYIPIDTKGGTVSSGTLWYWAKLAPEVLANYTGRCMFLGKPLSWQDISKNLTELFNLYKISTVWVSGRDSVFPILADSFRRAGVNNPFNELPCHVRRDINQWKMAASHFGWVEPECPKEYSPYYALRDAEWQSILVSNLWKFIPQKEITCPSLKSGDTTAQPTTT